MTIAYNLGILILVSQGFASLLLVIAAQFDSQAFKNEGSTSHIAIPGLKKIIRLFRLTESSLMMAFYFLSLVFVVFSYVGIVLLIIHTVIRIFS